MAFDDLRYPSIPFEALRDTFEALRTLAKPFGPLPLLHNILSLDPSGPPAPTDDFELLKRQFEPSGISRLISQAPLAGPSLPALASACGPVYFTSSHAVWYIVGPLQWNPLEFSLWFSLARSVVISSCCI